MESTHLRLALQAMVDDLASMDAEDMLQYDPCHDEPQNVDTLPSLDKNQR